jgi:hypothetical protein
LEPVPAPPVSEPLLLPVRLLAPEAPVLPPDAPPLLPDGVLSSEPELPEPEVDEPVVPEAPGAAGVPLPKSTLEPLELEPLEPVPMVPVPIVEEPLDPAAGVDDPLVPEDPLIGGEPCEGAVTLLPLLEWSWSDALLDDPAAIAKVAPPIIRAAVRLARVSFRIDFLLNCDDFAVLHASCPGRRLDWNVEGGSRAGAS